MKKPFPKWLKYSLISFGSIVVLSVALFLHFIMAFSRSEICKGYWAQVQEFARKEGRYPTNDIEICAYYHTTPEREIVEYSPPRGDQDDEIILRWKRRTILGKRIAVTKSGRIIEE
jgi:hypothetical protein